MCGRFHMIAEEGEIIAVFRLASVPQIRPRYNVAPAQDVLAVRADLNARRAEMLRWGLVPSWSKEQPGGNSMINARAETLDDRPAFRDAFARRRCLIPATGFFEWSQDGKTKRPWSIRMKDHRVFGIAGLWDTWRGPDQIIQTFTILTTTPNSVVANIHDRMPVIIAVESHDEWLFSTDLNSMKSLLKPFDSDAMDAIMVHRLVNDPRNDDPLCLEPADLLL